MTANNRERARYFKGLAQLEIGPGGRRTLLCGWISECKSLSNNGFMVALDTYPSATVAAQIAQEVLAANHKACLNVVPVVRSMYL